MRKVVVRDATAKDVDTCHAIEAACFQASEAASLANVRNRQRRFPEGFLVAESNGAIVGMINSAATNEPDLADEAFKGMVGHDPRGTSIVVFSVAVAPEHQGTGVSRVLIEAFAERSKKLGMRCILLLCKRHLLDYYRKFGYRNVGISASTHGGFEWYEMRKDLD